MSKFKEKLNEYKKLFEALPSTKERKNKKSYKVLSKEEKEKIEKKEFKKFVIKKEKEKFYYFALSKDLDVLTILPPDKNSEIKKFLGYEWSSAKGNEGIKYIANVSVDEALDEEDKRTLSNIKSINDIQTPLYNPKNIYDDTKLNKIIKDTLENKKINIDKNLEKFVNRVSLVNMLDIKEVEFNKVISLSAKKEVEIKSKWKLVKLGEVVDEIIAGQSPKSIYYNENKIGLPFYQGKKDFGEKYLQETKTYVSKPLKISIKNDILFSMRAPVGDVNINPFEKICIGRGLSVIRNKNKIQNTYLYNFLHLNKDLIPKKQGSSFEAITIKELENLKIPLPPIDIQQKIVNECEKVDIEEERAKKENEELKSEVESLFTNLNYQKEKLENIGTIQSGGTPSRKEPKYWNGDINWIRSEVCQNCYIYENQVKEKITELGLKNSNAKLFPKDTILIALVGATLGKIGYLTFATTTNQNIAGIYNLKNILPKYLFYILMNLPELNEYGKGGFKMISISKIKNLQIPFPPLEKQKEIISKIENFEKKINKNQEIIDNSKAKKEEILKKWL